MGILSGLEGGFLQKSHRIFRWGRDPGETRPWGKGGAASRGRGRPRLRRKVADADRLLVRPLVFDAFIENGDRTAATHPNLLVSNGRLFAIDHGQALPSVQGIVTKSLPFPFDSNLGWMTAQAMPQLLAEPLADLRALSDAAIDAAVEAAPTRSPSSATSSATWSR